MQLRSAISPALRWALVPPSLRYSLVVRCRNRYYDHAGRAARRADMPVISVGNLTAGGTGKTPLVIEIARRLVDFGRRPAVLTRGYRGSPNQPADEVLEFQQTLPDVPVVVNPDRVTGAATALADHAADCAVLDDGFQHRRLRRDLDIVLIDALRPWGGGWLLPAGRLREPLTSLARAHLLVISRSNQVDPTALERIHATLRRYVPAAPLIHANVEAERVVQLDGEITQASALADCSVLPVCGIGNPRTFQHLLAALTGRACAPLVFPDHHRYADRDVDTISRTAEGQRADLVVTTRKDWVKLAPLWQPAAGRRVPTLVRLDVRLVLADEAGVLNGLLKQALETGQ